MWKLEASERLTHWRVFRLSLANTNLEQAISATAELWQNCPYSAYYLDPTVPAQWPNAWELISENYYCDLAKSLGMLYTIAFSEHGHNLPMEIRVYNDLETGLEYNLSVFAEGKYVINFEDAKIVNIQQVEKKCKLVRCYDSTVLKLQ
jgi:hypothetical protein